MGGHASAPPAGRLPCARARAATCTLGELRCVIGGAWPSALQGAEEPGPPETICGWRMGTGPGGPPCGGGPTGPACRLARKGSWPAGAGGYPAAPVAHRGSTGPLPAKRWGLIPSCNTDQGVRLACEVTGFNPPSRNEGNTLGVTRRNSRIRPAWPSGALAPGTPRSSMRVATRKLVSYACVG